MGPGCHPVKGSCQREGGNVLQSLDKFDKERKGRGRLAASIWGDMLKEFSLSDDKYLNVLFLDRREVASGEEKGND